jgi:hypothetical protein
MYPNVTFDLPLVARVGKIADVMGAFLSEQIEMLEAKVRSEQPTLPENFVYQKAVQNNHLPAKLFK